MNVPTFDYQMIKAFLEFQLPYIEKVEGLIPTVGGSLITAEELVKTVILNPAIGPAAIDYLNALIHRYNASQPQ